jgi:hypothetical protein
MKLTHLLEERNVKPFMLHIQQRLIDDLDVDPELSSTNDFFMLSYEYGLPATASHVNVVITYSPNYPKVNIIFSFNGGSYSEHVDPDIEQVMDQVNQLAQQARDDIVDHSSHDDDDPDY